MLPEFFFRGSTGAYSMDEVQIAISSLQDLVKDKSRWEHWLFVFGTIVGKSFDAKVEAYNYSLIQKGGFGDGPEAGPSAAHAVLKELESSIDFIRAGYLAGGGIALERTHHLAPVNKNPRSEVQRSSYDGSSVFQQDGLTFGVEVCLDHLEGRLRRSIGLPSIDIQLVPSCGASIQSKSIVAKNGGYVFNSDGLTGMLSDLQKVVDATTRVCISSNPPVAVDTTGIRIAEIYPNGAGTVSIYPIQTLS
jgi:hypothetical protein